MPVVPKSRRKLLLAALVAISLSAAQGQTTISVSNETEWQAAIAQAASDSANGFTDTINIGASFFRDRAAGAQRERDHQRRWQHDRHAGAGSGVVHRGRNGVDLEPDFQQRQRDGGIGGAELRGRRRRGPGRRDFCRKRKLRDGGGEWDRAGAGPERAERDADECELLGQRWRREARAPGAISIVLCRRRRGHGWHGRHRHGRRHGVRRPGRRRGIWKCRDWRLGRQ